MSLVAVTGANGFVGRHVVRSLVAAGHEVIGLGQDADSHPEIAGSLAGYVGADLADGFPLEERLDAVVHLAGLASVGPSFDEPQRYLTVNSAIVTHLAETLLRTSPGARVVGVSSGAVYGGGGEHPFTERDPLVLSSPYVVSKVLLENQLGYYASRGLQTVVVRPFNHIGPGQGPGYLVPDLTARLLALPDGEPLTVGNLESSRDYSDVRDVADAYVSLLDTDVLADPVYNVCSGRSVNGHDVLAMVCGALGREVPPLHRDVDQLRVADPDHVTGDAALLHAATGWRPVISVEQSIADHVAERAAAK